MKTHKKIDGVGEFACALFGVDVLCMWRESHASVRESFPPRVARVPAYVETIDFCVLVKSGFGML